MGNCVCVWNVGEADLGLSWEEGRRAVARLSQFVWQQGIRVGRRIHFHLVGGGCPGFTSLSLESFCKLVKHPLRTKPHLAFLQSAVFKFVEEDDS